MLTIFSDRSLLIRRYHLTQLVNMVEIWIMLIAGHRLILKFVHFPIVFRDDVVWIIFLMHVLLLCLILMMRVTIHDAELLIFAENITNTERSRHRRRQHSKAFFQFPIKSPAMRRTSLRQKKFTTHCISLQASLIFLTLNKTQQRKFCFHLGRAWKLAI